MFHPEYYDVQIVQTEEELKELAVLLSNTEVIYFDTETSGLRVRQRGEDYIVGWTFAVDDSLSEKVYYIPVRHLFEGEYVAHMDWKKTGLKEKDFPEFTEEAFTGNWHNVDPVLVLNTLKPILEGNPLVKSKVLVAHNISFDLHVLEDEGVSVLDIFKYQTIFDTMVAYHTINEEGEKKLEEIVRHTYGVKKSDYKNVMATVTSDEKKENGLKATNLAGFQFSQIPIGGTYSSEDVWFMKTMYPDLVQSLIDDGEEQSHLFYSSRMPLVKVLWKMERRGMRVDLEKRQIMADEAVKSLEEIRYRVFEICGVEFNIGSGQQVAEILFGFKKKLAVKAKGSDGKTAKTGEYKDSFNSELTDINFNFKPISWTTGGADKDKNLATPQTTSEVLSQLLEQKAPTKGKYALKDSERKRMETDGYEVVKLLIKFAKLKKLHTSFMVGLLEQLYSDGRAHPSFNICGTDSWRLSCDHPNLQQLPKPMEGDEEDYEFWKQFEIRELFIPDNPDTEVVIAGD